MKLHALLLSFTLCASPAFSACNVGPLEDVFPAFATSIALQKEMTAAQVTLSTLDAEAEPEPKAISRPVAQQDLEWPLIADLEGLLNAGGSIRYDDITTATGAAGKRVTLRGDNGYLMKFTFSKDPCWQLEAIADESL